jgi:deoxyribodipyrimidine photolyase-like uncharacterized protein
MILSCRFHQNRVSNGDGACPYDWVYERILDKAREEASRAAAEAAVEPTVQWGFDVERADVAAFSRKACTPVLTPKGVRLLFSSAPP